METLGNAILLNSAFKFYCKCCDYGTSKKSSYNDHLLSAKHAKNQNGNVLETNGNQNLPQICSSTYSCEKCKKVFKNRSGLWKHNSKGHCNNLTEITDKNNDITPEIIKLISELVKGQNGLQESILEIAKNGTTNNSHNTTTNSHNKAFNLQFFLNETCKDAMNITDFIESIQLQLSDLEKMGEIGYVEGISNIIVKNLNALDVTQRPLHCTDKKRETIYIKDEDKWEKDEEKNKIRKVIKKVATKNARLIQKFKEKHPDYNDYHSKYSTQYHKLIIESFGGSGNNDLEKEDKIIRNIAKNIVVDK
jgi:Txe/YoeB family toxin of Txe-Axe toxin-antitoxin module